MIQSLGISSQNGLSEQVEFYRTDANRHLSLETRFELGQFMTPAPVASFMASLFRAPSTKTIKLLDPGAGVGSLTAAFVEKFSQCHASLEKISVTAYEIDPLLIKYLNSTLRDCERKCQKLGIEFDYNIIEEDFICSVSGMLQTAL
ncbi:MAG: N-6 DNA methylase, partial [candidate division KSB1 bacterium]